MNHIVMSITLLKYYIKNIIYHNKYMNILIIYLKYKIL